MTFEEVEKNIEGSILKGQYLEAFLLQSAYIEGLLKNFAHFQTWRAICNKKELDANGKKIVKSLQNDVTRFGLRKLIDYIYEAEFLEKEEQKKLHEYREIRNEIVHSLVSKISLEDFNLELKNACTKGKVIMGIKIIQGISELNKNYELAHTKKTDK